MSKAPLAIFVTVHSKFPISTFDGIVIETYTVGLVLHITSHSAGSTLVTVNFSEYPS